MKANEVATGGTKAETDQADGPRSTAKLEHKGCGKGTKAQAGQRHGVVRGAGGHARLSGTVKKPKGWVGSGLGSGPELGGLKDAGGSKEGAWIGRAYWKCIWHANFGPWGCEVVSGTRSC